MLSQNALYYYSCCIRIRTLTYLTPSETGPDLAPFPIIDGVVAKASQGQFPPPFLIRMYKNGNKDKGEKRISY